MSTENERTCKVRQGFFVLRDCKRAASVKCSACKRYMCAEHIYRKPDQVGSVGGGLRCTECAAKFEQDLDGPDAHRSPSWRHRYRRSYYSRYHYQPYYYGRSRYDDYDTRSFRQREGVEHDTDDSDVDFYDS